MSRFREEVRTIPRTVRVIAVLLYVIAAFLMVMVVSQWGGSDFRNLPGAAKVVMVFLAPAPMAIWVLLIGFVYADAKRRRMRYGLWTFLAFIVPYFIGVILYFLMRDPLPSACPTCGFLASASFTFCPQCGTALKPMCPQCGKSVDRAWANCAFCGRKLDGSGTRAA